MTAKPDFYLSAASEMKGDLATTRACWIRGRLRDEIRDDYLLVEVAPPIIGQAFGLGEKDISFLIVSSRHHGATLCPVSSLPTSVYIARLLNDDVMKFMAFSKNQIELIGWGMIFQTFEQAEAFSD